MQPLAIATPGERLREALADCLSGFTYITRNHGRLYGVGWERIKAYAPFVQSDNRNESATAYRKSPEDIRAF
jgi:hypothetical protein